MNVYKTLRKDMYIIEIAKTPSSALSFSSMSEAKHSTYTQRHRYRVEMSCRKWGESTE
jgi:hypothetical protein